MLKTPHLELETTAPCPRNFALLNPEAKKVLCEFVGL